MKNKIKAALASGAAAAAIAATVGVAAPAQAEVFLTCGSDRVGVATSVTSCAFAHQVRYAWFTQPGQVVEAYSPITGQYYDMLCGGGFVASLDNGQVVNSVRCVGGNNAVVVVW